MVDICHRIRIVRELEAHFSCRHMHYVGDDFNDNTITVELISECIDKLKKGKAQVLMS